MYLVCLEINALMVYLGVDRVLWNRSSSSLLLADVPVNAKSKILGSSLGSIL